MTRITTTRDRLAAAHGWMTGAIERLLLAEIANERAGGVSPATIASTVDSLTQMPEDILDSLGWQKEDYVAFSAIVANAGPEAEVRDVLRPLPALPSAAGELDRLLAEADDLIAFLYEKYDLAHGHDDPEDVDDPDAENPADIDREVSALLDRIRTTRENLT